MHCDNTQVMFFDESVLFVLQDKELNVVVYREEHDDVESESWQRVVRYVHADTHACVHIAHRQGCPWHTGTQAHKLRVVGYAHTETCTHIDRGLLDTYPHSCTHNNPHRCTRILAHAHNTQTDGCQIHTATHSSLILSISSHKLLAVVQIVLLALISSCHVQYTNGIASIWMLSLAI